MDKYVCEPCGYIYDPEVGDPDSGIAPGTAFENIPMIGYARSAAWAKTCSQRCSPHPKSGYSTPHRTSVRGVRFYPMQLQLGVEIVPLIVDDDERWKVLSLNTINSLHAQIWIIEQLNPLYALLGQYSRSTANAS